jgi:hypothetical protein
MSAIVACNAGLSLSLLQQRLTLTLLPPQTSLWISHCRHPLPFHPSPTFVNHHRSPDGSDSAPPLPLFFVVILSAVKDLCICSSSLPLPSFLLLFLLSSPKGNRLTSSLHADLLKESHYTKGSENSQFTRPRYLSSQSSTSFISRGRSSVTSCGVSRSTCFLSASGVPNILNSGFCAFSTENV